MPHVSQQTSTFTTGPINTGLKNLATSQKIFVIGLIIWMVLQLIRIIALPLLNSINMGLDAPGWMYPAVLDLVCASLALPLALGIWKWRSLGVWTFSIAYLTLSIVDHIGALTNLTVIGTPAAFEQMGATGNPFTAPIIQTALDIVFFYLLLRPNYRRLFFDVATSKS